MARRHVCIAITCWLAVFTVSQRFAFCDDISIKSKAVAHYILAVNHELNGQSRQAFEEYSKSVALDPNQATSRLKLAAYDIRFDKLDEAIDHLKAIIQLNPHDVQAHYLLGLVYSSQKKMDLAAQEYEEVLRKASDQNPLSVEVHAYLAQLYYAQGQMEKAVGQFKKIVQLEPNNVPANYLLGAVYADQGKRELAKQHFQKVLSIQPDHDGALNALAYAFAEEGVQLSKAREMAQRAIELDPTNGAYYDTYGWVLFKQGQYAESLMALQKAESLVQDPIVYEHLGDVYKAFNQVALARKAWLKSLSYDPNQPRVKQKLEVLEKIQAFERELK